MLIPIAISKVITTAILAIGGIVLILSPVSIPNISESGQELLEDYQSINEWFDKQDKTEYEEALEGYEIDINKEDFITPSDERVSLYIQDNRHQQSYDINFSHLFRELPKPIQQEIKKEESNKEKFNQSFNIEDVIAEKYIEWFYYNETSLIYTNKGVMKRK